MNIQESIRSAFGVVTMNVLCAGTFAIVTCYDMVVAISFDVFTKYDL